MKIYIAGPMTGVDDLNFPAFNAAADALRSVGYDVMNPADHGNAKKPWTYYMRLGLRDLLECDGIALLPRYPYSKGARLEKHVAEQLGLQIKTVAEWLTDPQN